MTYPIKLTEDEFNLSDSTAGDESKVATYKVGDDKIIFADMNRPVVLALTTTQMVTVSADSTETKALDPGAPRVPFMDDPTDGKFTPFAYLAGYYDESGDGSKDSLVTDSTGVKVEGFTTDDNFVSEVTLTDTTGSDQEVQLVTVVRAGQGRIRRRHKGTGTVTDQLAKADSIEWAFSDPHDRERRQTWPEGASGMDGAIGPNQYVDVLFYDNAAVVSPTDANATNLRIQLPFQKRDLLDEETAQGVRQRVKQSMAE